MAPGDHHRSWYAIGSPLRRGAGRAAKIGSGRTTESMLLWVGRRPKVGCANRKARSGLEPAFGRMVCRWGLDGDGLLVLRQRNRPSHNHLPNQHRGASPGFTEGQLRRFWPKAGGGEARGAERERDLARDGAAESGRIPACGSRGSGVSGGCFNRATEAPGPAN